MAHYSVSRAMALGCMLVLAACQAVPVQPMSKPTSAKPSFEQVPQAALNATAPWQAFIFDIQVANEDGQILQQTKTTYTNKQFTSSRLLIPAGSIGHGGARISTQATTGLWYEPHMGKARADLFVDVSWPVEKGDLPADMKDAEISSARISCAEWAQAVAVKPSSSNEFAQLKAAIQDNYTQKRNQDAKFLGEPYHEKGYWIFPILITVKGKNYESVCL